ncbi:MAG: ACT domain-containing protein [Verrucomicrobiae bacterium]|nr:ACT domain-containing protein [Verrucomicrobiae bacterium]
MQLTKQLAIFLENRPGMLAAVCEALAEQKINVYALMTSDTIDHSVVRMVVSDTRKAMLLFEERGTLVVEDEVILVEGGNKAGELAKIAKTLAQAKVNIEYCYCAASSGAKKGLLVLRVSNPQKALKALNMNM